MNSNNHTGTLYSFTTMNEDWWYHTSDLNILKEIAFEGFISEGSKILIEGNKYKIKRVSAEVLAGSINQVSKFHHGDANPFSIQLFVYV